MVRRMMARYGAAGTFDITDRPGGASLARRDSTRMPPPAARTVVTRAPDAPLAWMLHIRSGDGRPMRVLKTAGEALAFIEGELPCYIARSAHWRHARTSIMLATAAPDDDDLMFHATRVLAYACEAEGVLMADHGNALLAAE